MSACCHDGDLATIGETPVI